MLLEWIIRPRYFWRTKPSVCLVKMQSSNSRDSLDLNPSLKPTEIPKGS